MPDLDTSSVPAWGVFALVVIWFVLQFVERVQKHQRSKSVPPGAITPEQVSIVIRDQNERAEVLHLLREHQDTLRDHYHKLSAAIELLSKAQDRQTTLLHFLARDLHRVLRPDAPFPIDAVTKKGDPL